VYAFTSGGGCSSGELCLSLDPNDYEPAKGYCMPTANLKSQAQVCSADCNQQLNIEVAKGELCVCTSVCGFIEGSGGGDPPTCDPAYGCIDI